MEWHPYSKLFPLLGTEQLQTLADDIEAHGLRQPIVIDSHERIIDGRNRHAACQLAGVKPVYEPFTGTDAEVLKLVVSLNLHRRHLTESQRAMIAAEITNIPLGTNRFTVVGTPIGVPTERVSIPKAAELMNVGTSTIDRAKRVVAKGIDEVKAAVIDGSVTVSAADRIVKLPANEQPAALADTIANPPRQRPHTTPAKAEEPQAPEPKTSTLRATSKGIGIEQAHAAIAELRKIPPSDPFRKRAYEIVSQYMKSNP